MHELSIAMNIVEIAEEEAKIAKSKTVREIEIEIGELSGIIYEALDFAMTEAVKGSILEKAEIIINRVSGKARCENCAKEFEIFQLYDPCPACSSFHISVIQGKELKIKSLLVD